MTTLDASVWLLIKEKADPDVIHEKLTSIYRLDEQMDFLWLCLYYGTQADHSALVISILDQTASYVKEIAHVLTKDVLVTCVNEAIRKANHTMISTFLDRDPDLCAVRGGFYVADSRFKMTYSPIGLAIHMDAVDTLRVLIQYYRGQPIGSEELTPLHLACRWPATKCVSYLLADEKTLAGINTVDADGWTPLLYAGMYHPDAILALLEHGADVKAIKPKVGNVLQILSNWCIRGRPLRCSADDPCPTLGRRRTRGGASNPVMFIPDNFVVLAAALVERGVDVNADYPPLLNFAVNVHRRLGEIRGSSRVREIFKEAMDYLAAVSSQAVRDKTMLKLCHIVNFIATQLRRSSDYDNMVGYIELLSFMRELFRILIVRGANADSKEAIEFGEKKIRSFQYLLPFSHPCCSSLRKLIAAEFGEPPSAASGRSSTIDIILIAIMGMYSLQVEEPELYSGAMTTMADIVSILGQSGAKCRQPLHFFACLCVDPPVSIPILRAYLRCHSQRHYHGFLSRMHHYLADLSEQESAHFAEIRSELTACQNRMYTLKQLLRRDIIAFLGGWQHTHKISTLPLPESLKSYLMNVDED